MVTERLIHGHTHSCLKMASWELKCSGWHRAKASICFQSHRGNVEPGRALNWFRSEKVGCHTFAHWCLLFPYIQNQTAWQGNPLWAKRTHIILFCSFKVQTRGPLCYRCTVVKNHDIALLLRAQDSTAGLCIILCSCSQCTSETNWELSFTYMTPINMASTLKEAHCLT